MPKIRTRMDYRKSLRKIQQNGKKIRYAYDQRKTNKLEQLVKKSDQKRQRGRNVDRLSQTRLSLQHKNMGVNLSQKELPPAEVSLIFKGLQCFIQSPGKGGIPP